MSIAAAGFGASKALEEILGEQMLRGKLQQEQQRQAEAQALEQARFDELRRMNDANLAFRGREEDRVAAADRQVDNTRGVRAMVGEAMTQGVPVDDMQGMAFAEGIALPTAGRDPIADHEAKAMIDAKYREPKSGPAPDFEWVIRGGQPTQIRKGTAIAGDKPYNAVAARQEREEVDLGDMPGVSPDDTLWNRVGWFTTGPLSIFPRTAGRVTGLGQESIGNIQAFDSARNTMLRALSENPRFPVAEANRIASEINISPNVWDSSTTLRTRMREVDKYLAQVEARRENQGDMNSVMALRQFRAMMGVPKAELPSGATVDAPASTPDEIVSVQHPDGSVERFNKTTGQRVP